MTSEDPIAALAAQFDMFQRKLNQQIEELTVTVNQTHTLVNSRMSRQLDTMRKLAEAQERVASMLAEKRGIKIGREQAREARKKDTSDG